jgi:putative membrane protein insertion efficiency factor
MKRIVIGAIRIYQYTLSGLLGPCCRFYPSCSNYSVEAVRRHGVVRGLWLGFKRICRCHPFHRGGVDFVPEALPKRKMAK